MQDIFADLIGNVAVTGSVVRVDFVRLSPAVDREQPPKLEFSHRVVMPLEGFLRSLETLEAVRNKLLEDGIIKRQPAAQSAAN